MRDPLRRCCLSRAAARRRRGRLLSGDLPQTRGQRIVDVAERLRRVVRVLADLVGDRDEPAKVCTALELLTELTDERLEIVCDLSDVLDRCHSLLFLSP